MKSTKTCVVTACCGSGRNTAIGWESGAGLIIIGTGLFVGWQDWQSRLRDADAARFTAAIAAAQSGADESAIRDLEVLAATGHGGYGLIARIEAAALQGSRR